MKESTKEPIAFFASHPGNLVVRQPRRLPFRSGSGTAMPAGSITTTTGLAKTASSGSSEASSTGGCTVSATAYGCELSRFAAVCNT